MKILLINLLICLLPAAALAESQRPNILFLFSDDHSMQTLGAHKSRLQAFIKKHQITPNLDRLAAEGAYFENSFVCNSICGPSRAAILTGKHSWINGFRSNGDTFDGTQWNMAKQFQKNGYETAVYGKWHLGTAPTGFDEAWVLPGQGSYYNPDFKVNGSEKMNREKGYVSDVIADKTINWLKNRQDKNKPFFLCSWHKAPHRTWMPHPRHFDLLEDVKIPEPLNLFDDYKGRSSALAKSEMDIDRCINLSYDLKVTQPLSTTPLSEIKAATARTPSIDHATLDEFSRMTPLQKKQWDAYYVPRNQKFRRKNLTGKELLRWKYQAYLKDYLRCIKALDENIGRVLAYLKESGLDKNTIVLYSSDQGFYNGEHGWYDKRWMYEESLRTPFIIKWPGTIKPNTRITQMIQNIDFAPTLLDCAGIDIPTDVQGASFKKILQGKKDKYWRKNILYTYYGRGAHRVASHYGVRGERYKLIHFQKTNEWELYDLYNDSNEMTNLYSNPEYRQIINTKKEQLSQLLKDYKVEVDR